MKVVYARVSANKDIFHPGIQKSIKGSVDGKGYPGMEMSLTGQGVKMEYKTRSLVIPLHMFDFVEVEPNVKKASK